MDSCNEEKVGAHLLVSKSGKDAEVFKSVLHRRSDYQEIKVRR